MNISKFAVGQPDSDGDVRQPEVECVITNPTQHDVRMIRQSLIVTDKNGFCIGHNANNQEDCDIEPGGDTTTTPWLTFEQGFSETEEGSFNLTVSATLYARVFFKLGEVAVPTSDLSRVTFEREISSTIIEGPLKVSVLRGKPDEDGKIGVKTMVIVRNKSDHELPRVDMKSELLDSDGGLIEESSYCTPLDARCATCVEGGFPWLQSWKLRKARIRVGLYVYRPVHQCESSATNTMASGSEWPA
jgi:hypothetical protein